MIRYLLFCLILLSLSCNNDKERDCFTKIFDLKALNDTFEIGEEYSIAYNRVELKFTYSPQNGYTQTMTKHQSENEPFMDYLTNPTKTITSIAIEKEAYQKVSQAFREVEFWCSNTEFNQKLRTNHTLYIFKSTYKGFSKSMYITPKSTREIKDVADKLWSSIPIKVYKNPVIQEQQRTNASYFNIISINKPISFQVFIDGMKTKLINDSTAQFKIAIKSILSCYETFQNGDTYFYETHLELKNRQNN